MTFGKDVYYLLFALAFGATTLILIPKRFYKKFFIYGLLFGGAFNVMVILILGAVFHLFKYVHTGSFGIWGLFSFWTPLSWIFTFMIYLFFLPVRKTFLYPYIASFITFGYMVGQALKGLGLFQFFSYYQYFEPVTLIIWFSLAAWVYVKEEKIVLK